MQDMVRTCGANSKERFIKAAITIQKWTRGRFIRNLLKPYFILFRKVSPLVKVLEKYNTVLQMRAGFYSFIKNAAPEEKSEIISQVDMVEEEKILKMLRYKESQKKNDGNLGIQIEQSNEDSFFEEENQTYKLIMSNNDASHHEGFSIEDDSGEDSEEDEKYFDN